MKGTAHALKGMAFPRVAFCAVHNHNLVYNTCWEDPRLDRQALQLGPDDTLAMITSAGCNALDYALDGPRRIYCIDVNPRQNAPSGAQGRRDQEPRKYPQFFAISSAGESWPRRRSFITS